MSKSFKKNDNKPKQSVNKTQVLDSLNPIIEEAASELGLQVIDVTFTREHGKHFLRIYIYSEDRPITHEECTDMTRLISSKSDDSDIIDTPYSLEVSSPGIYRKLKNTTEYDIFKGKLVKITLKEFLSPENKVNVYSGELLGLSEDHNKVLLNTDNDVISIQLDKIKTAQLEG